MSDKISIPFLSEFHNNESLKESFQEALKHNEVILVESDKQTRQKLTRLAPEITLVLGAVTTTLAFLSPLAIETVKVIRHQNLDKAMLVIKYGDDLIKIPPSFTKKEIDETLEKYRYTREKMLKYAAIIKE